MDHTAPKQRINAIFGKYKYPVLIVLVGVGLMLLPQQPRQRQDPPVPTETLAEVTLEERLETVLAMVDGAGQVRVLLTEDTGRETLYQTDTSSETGDSGSRRSDDTVLLEDSSREESALVRQILEPKYRGAVVLCQGADAPSVRLAIVEAVRCVTGLGADKISVLKMK